MLWQLVGEGALQCGEASSTMGSQKLTVLVVFLMPVGFREVGMFKLSIWEVAARLGTLNVTIPSLSNVA